MKNDNAIMITALVCITICILLFYGEPDLMQAIIERIKR